MNIPVANYMKLVGVLIIGFIFSLSAIAQKESFSVVSTEDSILLQNFWADLTDAINHHDKNKLATLCDLPFYCRPCIDDTTLKRNNHLSIKVTKKLFYESQYKIFFAGPIKSEVEKHTTFTTTIFSRFSNDQNKEQGFSFLYTIIAPSKKWEGLQGVIYLKKRSGIFRIAGIDTIP